MMVNTTGSIVFALALALALAGGCSSDTPNEVCGIDDPVGSECEDVMDCYVRCMCEDGRSVGASGGCLTSQGECLSPDSECAESCENVGSEWTGDLCEEVD